jgi:exodeoxyribonuclease V gamma subunit
MLHICRSNRVEALLDRLARRLGTNPPASPFTPELVVTPSPAMARWVQLGLARAHGVAANLSYPLPASFVWQLARDLLGDLPEEDALALEPMAWRIFGALPGLLAEPAFTPLRHYLAADAASGAAAVRRWQLATRIADAFDRYQLYRPDLIRGWSDPDGRGDGAGATGEDAWQPILWRHLIERLGQHRVAVIDRLLGRLAAGPCPGLPERASLFAVSSLPPLLVEVFRALAARTRVDLYLHCPTDQFWADLVTQKVQARKRLDHPEEADLWEVGNPLLSSWGRQGQALQDLLLCGETPMEDTDAWVDPQADTLLHRLQHDIFHLVGPEARPLPLSPNDSLQVQICHSPLRECQVLHDWLLDLFEREPDLRPEDCLVTIPEIDAYAPYIEAVFERDPSGARPHIPWNLSDISLRDEHPLIRIFLQLLDLPDSRFGHAEILCYLDVPELAQAFGLDAEAVAQVKALLEEARLRWGLDGAHKARLGLPEVVENTWAQAEQRLFGGYALAAAGCGPEPEPEPESDPGSGSDARFADIAPIAGVEGGAALALGCFWRLLAELQQTAADLARPRRVAEWQGTLSRLLATFFGDLGDPDGRVQKVRDALADLAEQAAVLDAKSPGGADEAIPLALVRHWLGDRLGNTSRRGRYFRGGVTFCGMRPMRSLPFQVICCLGLRDGVFPRPDRPVAFDLMRRTWRPGDPRKGDEDRYLFLETLLCARRRLYLSYVGRDLRRNAERQPSVLLRELLDAIDQRFGLPPQPDRMQRPGDQPLPFSASLTRVAPLQPFSPRNFQDAGPAAGPSFDAGWCELARATLATVRRGTERESGEPRLEPWPRTRLPSAPDALREVSLTQLERWLRHPLRHFVRTRLQIDLHEKDAEPDDEPFALDHLQKFELKRHLVLGPLGQTPGRDRGAVLGIRALAARGDLPHGAFAGLTYTDALEEIAPILSELEPYTGSTPQQVPVDLAFDPESNLGLPDGPTRLVGQIPGLYSGLGLLRVRPANLKGVDILALWLHHLAWCAAVPTPPYGRRESLLIAQDRSFRVDDDLGQASARRHLALYLRLYWEGLHRPLPVLPKASHAYARCLHEGKAPERPVSQQWNGNGFQDIPGEREDPYVQVVLRGQAPDLLAMPEFAELAEALYGEVLARDTAGLGSDQTAGPDGA